MIRLYSIFYTTFFLFALPFLFFFLLVKKKRRLTVLDRLGFKKPKKKGAPEDKTIWVHALSVGEVRSAIPLVKSIHKRHPGKKIVFSASTLTGYQTAEELLSDIADRIVFFPCDFTFSIRRKLESVNPERIIIVETDIWPNFLNETAKKTIPVFLVNARLSDSSYRGYKRLSFLFRKVFPLFSGICAQSEQDGMRFERLGVLPAKITVTGNMKFDQEILALLPGEADRLRKKIGGDAGKVFIAGSTHRKEEDAMCTVLSGLRENGLSVVLVLAPRDPERASEIVALAKGRGFRTITYSWAMAEEDGKGVDVVVVDQMGVLRGLYAICDLAFIGGSLVSEGGHNPLEAVAFEKPVIFGPDMSDFRQIAGLLSESGAAIRAKDTDQVYEAALNFLSDPRMAEKAGKKGHEVLRRHRGALLKTLEVVLKDV